jgi:hypothetical protein
MLSQERYFKNPYPNQFGSNDLNVDKKYWLEYVRDTSIKCMKNLKPVAKEKYSDGCIYTGNLGVIFMAYKVISSGQLSANNQTEYKNYMIECLKANEQQEQKKDVSFLVGKGGYLIMGCLVSKLKGEETEFNRFLEEYIRLGVHCEPLNFLKNGSDELFVGRAGYLSGFIFLRKYLQTTDSQAAKKQIFRICDSIIESGKQFSKEINSPCPLMYQYHGSDYLGR